MHSIFEGKVRCCYFREFSKEFCHFDSVVGPVSNLQHAAAAVAGTLAGESRKRVLGRRDKERLSTVINMGGFRRAPMLMAAFSRHLHEWLPGHSQFNFEKFRSALIKANVTRVAFLRHGQTAPSQGVDFDRILTDHGRQQAREAGSSFGANLKPFYSAILSSPAPRTMETAKLFLENANASEVQVLTDQVLYDGTMQPKGSPLFQRVGYAPLNDYLNHQDHQFRSDAQFVLGAYAHSVVDVIMNLVAQQKGDSNSTLCMVGHAIYLPAAALGVASLTGCDDSTIILSMNTKEAEGYLIDLERKTTSYLSRPSEETK